MTILRRLVGVVFHQSLIAQGVTAASALTTVALLARGLATDDYAHYAVVTALWAIGNAVVGTGTGTRVAKSAASGSSNIRFQRSELWISVSAAAAAFAYVGILRNSLIEGIIAGLCMLSFVAAEASTSFEIGLGRFNRYLFFLAARAVLPPLSLALLFEAHLASFSTAMLCVLAGNIASILLGVRRFSLKLDRSSELTGHSVGAINMGLWIIASADRLILERLVAPMELAAYALAYGLADRVYRSLSNAYIAKTLGRAFQGHSPKPSWKFYALSGALAIAVVPGIQVGSSVLSGGRYQTPLSMTVAISLAGLFMIWAAPTYVRLMASSYFKPALIGVFVLAGVNLLGNIAVAGYIGTFGAAVISAITYALWFIWLKLCTRPRNVGLDGARHLRVFYGRT